MGFNFELSWFSPGSMQHEIFENSCGHVSGWISGSCVHMDTNMTWVMSKSVESFDLKTYIRYLRPLQDENVKNGNSMQHEIFKNSRGCVSG